MNALILLSKIDDKVIELFYIFELEFEEKIIFTRDAKHFFDVGMGKKRVANIRCRRAKNEHKNYKSLTDGVVIEFESEALNDFALAQSSDTLMDS